MSYGLNDIKSIRLLRDIETIQSGCFVNCENLEEVYIPDTVTSIESNAFRQSSGVSSVIFVDRTDDEVKSLLCGDYFSIGLSRRQLMLENGDHVYDNYGNTLIWTSSQEDPLEKNISVLKYSDLEKISENATNYSIEKIEGGEYLSVIDEQAARNCSSLKSAILPNVTDVGNYAFSQCANLSSIFLPKAQEIYDGGFYSCYKLASVDLPNVIHIGGQAFYIDQNLCVVNAPKATIIGLNAFYGCKNLISVNLPNVSCVYDGAFCQCSSLTSISLPNAVAIGKDAFIGCNRLAAYYFDSMRTSDIKNEVANWGIGIDDAGGKFTAIVYCKDEIVVVNDASDDGESSDSGESSGSGDNSDTQKTYGLMDNPNPAIRITYVDGSSKIKEVGSTLCYSDLDKSSSFEQNDTIVKVEANDKVTYVADYAFYNCYNINTVSLPDVVQINGYSFAYCLKLESITIPQALAINKNAFLECGKLTSIDIPNATFIGDNAFNCCRELKKINCPKIDSIGNCAFYYCSKLENGDFRSVQEIGGSAFFGCDKLVAYTLSKMKSSYIMSNILNWSIGISSTANKFMVIIYCADGIIVVNDMSDDQNS